MGHKECLHNNVCKKNSEAFDHNCSDFISKACFIKLPCEIGSTVYVIEPLLYSIFSNEKSKCLKCEFFYEGGMGDHPDCTSKNPCHHIVEYKDVTLRQIIDWITPSTFTEKIAWGKTAFPTKEQAEKTLTEGTYKS